MLKANEYEIRKLLFDSKVSRYRISKETGIPQNTLSDLVNGKTDINKVRFDNAAKLTEYAIKIEEDEKNMEAKRNEMLDVMENAKWDVGHIDVKRAIKKAQDIETLNAIDKSIGYGIAVRNQK